jgi:hypothetical protein
MFQKLDLFQSSVKIKVAPTLLGPIETASLNHCPDVTEGDLEATGLIS